MFKRQFDLVSQNDGHRSLLQQPDAAPDGQTVGSQLLALERVDFVAQRGEADFGAGRDEGKGQADFVGGAHDQTARRIRLNRPPMKKAKGTMTATMPSATLLPCSLTIIIRLAKQGMNNVIVIMPTTA